MLPLTFATSIEAVPCVLMHAVVVDKKKFHADKKMGTALTWWAKFLLLDRNFLIWKRVFTVCLLFSAPDNNVTQSHHSFFQTQPPHTRNSNFNFKLLFINFFPNMLSSSHVGQLKVTVLEAKQLIGKGGSKWISFYFLSPWCLFFLFWRLFSPAC